jgi:exonuclease V gamma subunit
VILFVNVINTQRDVSRNNLLILHSLHFNPPFHGTATPRGPTQIPLPDLNYIWHGTFHNLLKTTAKMSRSYFYFLMIYGCHSQTNNLFFIYINITDGCRSDLLQAVESNIFFY